MRSMQKPIITSLAIAMAFAVAYLAFAPHSSGQGDTAGMPVPTEPTIEPMPRTPTPPPEPTAAPPADPYAPVEGVDHERAGRQLFWNRDYEGARVEFERANRQHPGRFRTHYLLGLVHHRLGDLQAAERELVTAREVDNRRPETLVNLARLYMDMELPEEALEMAVTASELDSTDSSAWNQRGRARLALGDGDLAIDAFSSACALDADNAYAWNNLGYALIQVERFDEAIGPLEEAVALRDDVGFMFNNLGVALECEGRLAEAAAAYAAAADLEPGSVAELSLARLEAILPESTEVAVESVAIEADLQPESSVN